jgi:hypothetical protein
LAVLSFLKGFMVLILKDFEANSKDINFKDQQLTNTKSLQLKSTKMWASKNNFVKKFKIKFGFIYKND